MSTTDTPGLDDLAARLAKARTALALVRDTDVAAYGTTTACAVAAAHLADTHGWKVTPAETGHAAALRAMHLTAHQLEVQDAEDALGFAAAEALSPESDRLADRAGGLDDYENPAYLAWLDGERKLCRAVLAVGPAHDPYSATCDHGDGHYPHTDHEGDDPFGAGGRVSWRGGGTCAGDPLPQFDVVWRQSTEGSETV